VANATARIGTENYPVEVVAGHHPLTSDEPAERGGRDSGPAPHELLCAALAACTAITLRMYAERKGWPLHAARVDVRLRIEGSERLIDRRLSLEGELDSGQRARLTDIAERTPVTLTLKQGTRITTVLE
jgi:putative redox protein